MDCFYWEIGDNLLMITGNTRFIAHIGYPTHTFKSPMIYNPYFEYAGIDAVVVPFSVQTHAYADFLKAVFSSDNIVGALITMPYKVVTTQLVQRLSVTAQIAGACNAVRLANDGVLEGDMFDGEGFVQGMKRKGCLIKGQSALVVGSGGVGSAIAASLAAAGVAKLGLYDVNEASALALARRLQKYYPELVLQTDNRCPTGFDIVVNATPLGMNDGDDMPLDIEKLTVDMFVGEVVLKNEMTPFLQAAKDRGCTIQVATDMLFEQIPVYLDYFGLPTASAEVLRQLARI